MGQTTVKSEDKTLNKNNRWRGQLLLRQKPLEWSSFKLALTTDRVVIVAIVAQERLFCAFFAGSIGATLIGVAFAPSPYLDLVPTVMG
jgi:hypothetical protein